MSILFINANEIITMAGACPKRGSNLKQIGVVKNASLLIDGEKIIDVAPLGLLQQKYPSLVQEAYVIDVSGKIICPGFIDAHTHMLHNGTREQEFLQRLQGADYLDLLKAGGGIYETARRTDETSYELLLQKVQATCQQFLHHGITTVEAKISYSFELASIQRQIQVLQQLQKQPLQLVGTLMAAHVVPPRYAQERAYFIDLLTKEWLPVLEVYEQLQFQDVFCDARGFRVDEAQKILLAAKRLKPIIHAQQFADDGGLQVALDVQAVQAAHINFINATDMTQLAKSETTAMLLPGSAFYLQMQYPNARHLIEKGALIALASDYNPGSSPSTNIQFMMNLATLKLRMTIEEVLAAITINAAYALNLHEEIGSLENGKQADLVVLNVENYEQLQYFYAMNHVDIVIKKGKVLQF